MKRVSTLHIWSVFLIAAGIFLLAKNLGGFGAWGDMAVGALFALIGVGFLLWFLFDFQRWWRVIPGFTLLGVAALSLLDGRSIQIAEWSSAIVIFGIALGFWVVLLTSRQNWWAVIPAGTLTLIGVLTGLRADLSESGWQAAFFAGLGVVFGLVYVMRLEQNDTRWGAVPAAALLLLSAITLVDGLSLGAVISLWWPTLLVVAGAVVLFLGTLRRSRPSPEPLDAAAPSEYDAIEPAPGASIIELLPSVVQQPPARARSADDPKPAPAPNASAPIDIYALLEQQPPPADDASER